MGTTKFDGDIEQSKRRRSHASGSYGCTLSHTASMEDQVSAGPTMAGLPKLESFAFTSSSTLSRHAPPYTEEEKGRPKILEKARLEVNTISSMEGILHAPTEEAGKENPRSVPKLSKAHTAVWSSSEPKNGGVDGNEEDPQDGLKLGDVIPGVCDSLVDADGDEQHPQDGLKLGDTIPSACNALVDAARELVADLEGLTFMPPVSCVYNPLVYARSLHEQYIRRHGGRRIEVLLVGMNPGPFGMAQTGVPFGDSKFVSTFHGLSGKVDPPINSHPKRPVYGLECKRSEISGQRLWGWAQDRFGCATAFFNRFWVYNYCPLVFMEASGKNRTPDKLHPSERAKLELACNRALIKTISILRPAFVIGVGKYAANKIQQCNIAEVKVGDIMHPSPANPHANKDWGKKIEAQLIELGIELKR